MTNRLKKLKKLADELHKTDFKQFDFEQYKENISLLIEELSISQVELELQNEELLIAQQSLELEKMRFADLFVNAPVGYLKLNSKGSILDFNSKMLQTLATSAVLIKNTPFIAFVDKDYYSAFYLHLQTVFNTNLSQNNTSVEKNEIEIAIVSQTKEKRFLRLHSNLMFDAVLNQKYCRTIAEDITSEKIARLQIQQLNERIEASMQAGNLAWWEVELPSGKVFFNENKAKMLGFKSKRFKHYTDFMKLVHPDDYEATMMAFKMHLNGEKETYECEYRIRNSENMYLWFHDIGKIVHQQRENIRVMGIVTNITEQKFYQQNLKESNDTKDRLISILAHDLRSPFSATMGFSELLLLNHNKYTEQKRSTVITTIYESTQNAYNLLENLLTWANTQTGKINYNPEILDLKARVVESSNMSKHILNAKNIKLTIQIPDSINIFSDKHFLDIILRNLLTNAIKFTPKNGEITIELENIFENSVEILIKDTGIGIAPKLLDDILKNGKTITTLGTENEKGSGLGLVLCKEFAIKNGGNIRFKSLENTGTSVYFSIPTSSKQTKLHLLHDFFDSLFLEKLINEIGTQIPSFWQEANESLFPKWEKLKDTISVNLINEANEQLFKFGTSFNSSCLIELHQNISKSLCNFSLDDMYFYITFVENLKNKLQY